MDWCWRIIANWIPGLSWRTAKADWFYCRDTWLSISADSDTVLQTRENPWSLLLSPGPIERHRERGIKRRERDMWRQWERSGFNGQKRWDQNCCNRNVLSEDMTLHPPLSKTIFVGNTGSLTECCRLHLQTQYRGGEKSQKKHCRRRVTIL